MNSIVIAFILFLMAYCVNIFYITVLYHRGLAHGSVRLSPFAKKLTETTGIWITGIDPKAWVCMHRLHHMYSDTEKDPHSPVHQGVIGVALGQLRSYEIVLRGLIRKESRYINSVSDLDFDVSHLNRKRLWTLPYLIHAGLAIFLGIFGGNFLIGAAYFLGIMSHPVQGWMVNSLAHRFGYRNFEIKDNSRNNFWVSVLVFGEGFQNNHHARPKSANFAKSRRELDLGYLLCRMAQAVGLLQISNSKA